MQITNLTANDYDLPGLRLHASETVTFDVARYTGDDRFRLEVNTLVANGKISVASAPIGFPIQTALEAEIARGEIPGASTPGGSSSAIISSTDPGAIGAGALWIRTDPSESYAPTVQVRNQADDGWLDEAVVGSLLGLTYYDFDGNVATSIFGDSRTANMVTPKGTLRLGGTVATLSDPARVDILGGGASVVVDGVDGQLILRAGADARVLMDSASGQISLTAGSGIAPLYVTASDVQSNFVVLIGTDVDAPLGAGRGAIVIGPSDEISDANLSPGWCGISYDDTNGAAKLKIKAKTADGTVVRGEIALTP